MYISSEKRRGFTLPKITITHALSLTRYRALLLLIVTAVLSTLIIAVTALYATSIIQEPVVSAEPVSAPVITVSAAKSNQQTPTVSAPATRVRPAQSAQATLPATPQCQKTPIIQPTDAPLAQPGLTQIVEAPRYYPVYGRSVEQIRQQLAACSPKGYFASTNYQMNWSYKSQSINGVCAIKDVRVGMHIIVQYPSWTKDQHTNPSVEQRWNIMIQNLIVHEQGHVNRNIQIAQEFVSALNAIPAIPCAQLSTHAQAVAARYSQALHNANSTYDNATNHGQSQGAWL